MSSGFIHFSHLKLVKASETIHLSGLQNMTLSENAKLRRKKHAKQNWKNKVERRKLEAKGQTTANVEEISPEFGQGLDDVDFSTVKIRQEKIDSSREEQEKLKCLREESKEKPGSHPFDEVIVEENQRTVAEFCKKGNLVLPADEVGDESRRSMSISQEDLEELMTSVKKDTYLKPILEDTETGGPTVMMSGLQNTTLSENAKLRRKKHAKQNWKNKMKKRKLEAKGLTEANVEQGGPMAAYVEEIAQMVPNVDKGASGFGQGLDDVDFSIIKIHREKVEYSREDQEKLKCLQEESKDNPGSHPSNEIIVEENQRNSARTKIQIWFFPQMRLGMNLMNQEQLHPSPKKIWKN